MNILNYGFREGAMSVEIKYDQNRKVLDVTVSGALDMDEFSSAFENITNSGDFPPDTNAIWDIRDLDISKANFRFIHDLVKIRSLYTKRGKCRAVVIVSSDLQYGLGRMFQMLSESELPNHIMVFRDYKEGEQWLLEKH